MTTTSLHRPLWQQAAMLVFFFLLCFSAAAIGAIGSMSAPEFYGQLQQPTWAPPAWLFGPVWTVLYAMMALAVWLVWRKGPSKAVTVAMVVFMLQLTLNTLWSWLFFSWRSGAGAFVEIILLWLLIAFCILLFRRIQPLAGYLLVPYLVWVTFASALNFALWQANPGVLG
jgi:tryptophan-rich sensory protein